MISWIPAFTGRAGGSSAIQEVQLHGNALTSATARPNRTPSPDRVVIAEIKTTIAEKVMTEQSKVQWPTKAEHGFSMLKNDPRHAKQVASTKRE